MAVKTPRTASTDAINLLLQLGKIGTRVQFMKDSGNLQPAQLFFKSLSQRTITWSGGKKSMLVTPYVIVLPGKVTGILSVSKQSEHIPEQLCLGIVSKDRVLEIVEFLYSDTQSVTEIE